MSLGPKATLMCLYWVSSRALHKPLKIKPPLTQQSVVYPGLTGEHLRLGRLPDCSDRGRYGFRWEHAVGKFDHI